jgi:hypothetical protein
VLVCEQDVEICMLWCTTNHCDQCRPPRGGRDYSAATLADNVCKSNCRSFCEYETNCWWKTVRTPLAWLGRRALVGLK